MPKFINKVIKILIASDFFLNLGWGFMGPIFTVFIIEKIATGSTAEAVQIAGFASMIYWVVKSILQIPVGHYLDRNHGEKDDFWFMTIGTFLVAFVPLAYLFSSQVWHLYLTQVFYAIFSAMLVPSWSAIFTRHVDRGREAVEWGSYSTAFGIAGGISGGVGGMAVASFGFEAVFIFISLFTALSALLLLAIKSEISPQNKETIRVPIEKMPL